MGPVCVCMGVDRFMVNWLWLYLPPPPTLKIVPTPLLAITIILFNAEVGTSH